MAGFRDPAAREREMRGVLEKWQQSGQPLRRFAEREGMAAKTLYRWRKRLGVGDDRVRRGRPLSDVSSPLFTEVSPSLFGVQSPVFEVVLPAGVTVRVPERFDAEMLRRLLGVLAEC